LSANLPFGRNVRLQRLYRHGGSRLLVVPMDHAVSDGPIVPDGGPAALVVQLAGSGVSKGATRLVTVGRVKIESRPLLSIDAVGPGGERVNLIVQDDWHVRVLGPRGVVLNTTELKAGDRVLGYLPTADRHVGYPIDEFCLEK
jgi:3-dehydroquinate synthase family protein